eukprot:451132_1
MYLIYHFQMDIHHQMILYHNGYKQEAPFSSIHDIMLGFKGATLGKFYHFLEIFSRKTLGLRVKSIQILMFFLKFEENVGVLRYKKNQRNQLKKSLKIHKSSCHLPDKKYEKLRSDFADETVKLFGDRQKEKEEKKKKRKQKSGKGKGEKKK